MGFWQNLLSSVTGGSSVLSPRVEYLGGSDLAGWMQATGQVADMSPAKMWASQPHFRTVVTFVARNMAQLGLHTFVRDDQGSRERDRSSILASSLAGVDGTMTPFELIFALAGDLLLYDRAYWWVAPSSEMPSGVMIRRLPPTWVDPVMSDPWTVKKYRVWLGAGNFIDAPPDKILAFPGYAPGAHNGASPTVDALRDTLQEQMESALYRSQTWKRGGRVSSVIERPADAPGWSDAARESFREDWYSKFTGRGSRAGGTPILEDGMSLKRIDFNAQEQQFVEAAKLSLVTVASAFHVNPTMIGQNDGANYSNVREFRKMLYGETLGPLIARIEDRINTFLVPMLGLDPATHYVEFNIAEKLQGSFEEQAAVISTSVGRPWMTADEARSRFNMPVIGGDASELVTPLNVLVGGQASPRDGQTAGGGGSHGLSAEDLLKRINAAAALIRSGFSPAASLEAVGLDPVEHLGLLPVTVQRPAAVEDVDEEVEDALKRASEILTKDRPIGVDERAQDELAKFFRRQGSVVQSQIGAGGEWWDGDRWDGELSSTITGLYLLTATEAGRKALDGLGISPDEYDEPRTEAFLLEAAKRSAGSINETTREHVQAAIDDPDGSVSGVFDEAVDHRAAAGAAAAVTFAAGFGTTEAARQVGGGRATKTWNVNSGNPRASHSAMSGETVPIDEPFSNGLDWPGSSGEPDEVAGCQCSVTVNIPD